MIFRKAFSLIKLMLLTPAVGIAYLNCKLQLRRLAQQPNITIANQLELKGKAIIDIHPEARLQIGKGVTLNSENKGYHINMHSPVKLFADKSNALISIGDNSRIHGTCIHAYQSIVIGKNCLIAANCHIIDCNGHDLSFPDVDNRINTTGKALPVIIEDSVWIGANSLVLPGVRIGYGSVISANSVVNKDIPPYCIAAGNPAVVIKTFDAAIDDPSKVRSTSTPKSL